MLFRGGGYSGVTPIGTNGDVTSSPNADLATCSPVPSPFPFGCVPGGDPAEPFDTIVTWRASPRGTHRARGSTAGAPRSRRPRCSGPRGTPPLRRAARPPPSRPQRSACTPAGVSWRVSRRRSTGSGSRSTNSRATSPSTTAVTLGGLTARRPASAEDALEPSPRRERTRYCGSDSSSGSSAVSTWRARRASARAAPGGTRTAAVLVACFLPLVIRHPHR